MVEFQIRSEEHTSELQSQSNLVCRLLLEKKKKKKEKRKNYHICLPSPFPYLLSFFFNDPPTTEIYTLSLHDALPILLGLDHTRVTFRFSGRDMRLTDVHGHVIKEILA